MPLPIKNPSPLLVDKVRGYLDQVPPWLRGVVTLRIEKQKFDAKIAELDPTALESKLVQEGTDEKLRTSTFLGDGEDGSGNDTSGLPVSHPSEIVITGTGQVASVTESVSSDEVGLVEGPPLQDGSSEQVGDLWVTKKVEAPTFDRKVFQLQRDDLMPQEFRAAIPEKTESHVTDGAAALPTLSAIELLRKEEQVKVGVKETTVQSRDTSAATPTLIGQRIDPEFNGATLNLAKSIVPDTSTITQPFGMTDNKILPYDDTKAVKETWSVDAAGFPVLEQFNYDAEMDAQVRTVVSIVPHGTPMVPYGLEYSERKIDAKHKMRIVSDTPSGVPLIQTFETRNFTFPALLLSLEFKLVALATTGRSEVQWTAGTRASFTVPIRFTTNTIYSGTAISPNPVITWAPGDITFKGVSYSIGLSNVLFNTWSNIGVTFAADAYYGNIVDRFSVSATYPNVSTYISWIGTQQRISSTVSRYKRYWVLKDSYITIQ